MVIVSIIPRHGQAVQAQELGAELGRLAMPAAGEDGPDLVELVEGG